MRESRPPQIDEERREMRRQRSRFRSGKLVAPNGGFLADCRILDLATRGACIALMADAPVPSVVWLYDDETAHLGMFHVAWRRGLRAGGVLMGDVQGNEARAMRRSLRADYYATRCGNDLSPGRVSAAVL